MAGCILLLWQLLCLLVIAVGWGVGVWLVVGRPAPFRRMAWVWCGLAGFCAHALVLQGLVYLGQPLARTAWPAFGAAWIGVAAGAWFARERKMSGSRAGWSDARLLLGVFAVVAAVHSVAIAWHGPAHYFGQARYDQANYVANAQFLVDEPFSLTAHDIGLHPWLMRPLGTKEERITQSVAHGALAVVSGTDCQQAYGAMVAFFMGLVGLAVAAWLRAYATPRWLAAIGGVGAGLGPAVTLLQLDGYFSQVSTLFVLPALATLLWPRQPLDVLQRWAAVLLLAFWAGAYTEVAAVGAGLVVALRITGEGPWSSRARDLGWIAAGALLANPGYTRRLAAFLASQWLSARDPNHLGALFPDSGTWLGWGRLFLDLPAERGLNAAVVGAGGAVLALMLAAVIQLPRRRRWRLLATLAVPVALLAALGLQPVLAKYPFAKLLAGFAPLWIGTAVLGVATLGRLRRGQRSALAALLLGAGAVTALSQQAQVIRREGVLAELDSPTMQGARDEARRHPERTYLVANDHPLLNQWLCYYGRASDVYLDRRHLGDRVVASETYAFRRLPAATTKLWWLDPRRNGPVENFEPGARLSVRGAIESGAGASGKYYVMRDTLELAIERPALAPPVDSRWLDLGGVPLAGATPCELELSGPGLSLQRTTLTGPRMLRFRLALSPGKNVFTLRLVSGAATTDAARTLILQSLSLDPVTPVELASDPLPASFAPSAR